MERECIVESRDFLNQSPHNLERVRTAVSHLCFFTVSLLGIIVKTKQHLRTMWFSTNMLPYSFVTLTVVVFFFLMFSCTFMLLCCWVRICQQLDEFVMCHEFVMCQWTDELIHWLPFPAYSLLVPIFFPPQSAIFFDFVIFESFYNCSNLKIAKLGMIIF